MSLRFQQTGIPELDAVLDALQEASEFANDSTRWEELEWQSYLPGTTPKESIDIALKDLQNYLIQHNKLLNKLKRQGFIQ